MRHLSIGVLVLTLVGVGASSGAQVPFSVFGVGNEKCSQWTANRTNKTLRLLEMSWVQGFLTGVAYENGGIFPSIDAIAMERWMDGYCAANPGATLPSATTQLLIEMLKRNN